MMAQRGIRDRVDHPALLGCARAGARPNREADTGIVDGTGPEQAAQLEQARTVQLEQALVSALVIGANWKLATGEHERLLEGCLTEKCRDIAEGKMSFGF